MDFQTSGTPKLKKTPKNTPKQETPKSNKKTPKRPMLDVELTPASTMKKSPLRVALKSPKAKTPKTPKGTLKQKENACPSSAPTTSLTALYTPGMY